MNFQNWKIATFQSLQNHTQSFCNKSDGYLNAKMKGIREAVIYTLRSVPHFLRQARIWEISEEEAGLWGTTEENFNAIQIIFY